MEGYLIIASTGGARAPIAPWVRSAIADRSDLKIVLDEIGLMIVTTAGLPVGWLQGGRGLVLGSIFPAAKSEAVNVATEAAGPLPGQIEPRAFMRAYWGNYIAILRDGPTALQIMRAPFGQLPCLHASHGDMLLVASDLALLDAAGWRSAGFNWDAIAHRLAYQNMPSPTTCLAGVLELQGGACLGINDGWITIAQAWTPWDHAGRRHWVGNREQGMAMLRQAVTTAIRAQVANADRSLLMLSGGLDSSVLAAALASQGGAYSCFNLSSHGGVGDERRYARAVARRLGASVIEAEWDVDLVDITRSHAAGLANPVARSFMQGTNALLADAIGEAGADLLIDGGGGDNIFCALQSAAPVTDAFVRGRSLRATWSTAQSIAALAQVGAPTVLAHAARRAFRRSPAYRWHPDTQYLAPTLSGDRAMMPGHPWLLAPKGAETGTAAHIALIVAAQAWAEASDLPGLVRRASPLASQPVVEACLRIPSWWWFDDGRNRMIARDAYADRLPADIVQRRSKGSPDGYIAALYAANRPTIRAMLLDGRLRGAGLLDAPQLERALGESALVRGTDYHRIMRLADVEAWIASRA